MGFNRNRGFDLSNLGWRFLAVCMMRLLQAVLLAFVVSLTAVPTVAQDVSDPMSEIVKSATDSGMKVVIIEGGKTTENVEVDPNLPKESLFIRTQAQFDQFWETLNIRFARAPALIEEVIYITNYTSPSGHYSHFFVMLVWTLVLLLISEQIVRHGIARRVFGAWFIGLQVEKPVGYTQKLPILLLRTLLAAVGLILVVLLSFALGRLLFGKADDSIVRLTVAYIYGTYFTARGVTFVWRMILAPYLEQYRIPALNDQEARKLYYWLMFGSSFAIISLNFVYWVEELGMGYDIYAFLNSLLTFFVVIFNVTMVLANRKAITSAILNGQSDAEVSVASRFASRAWAPAVILYFFVAWAEMTYRLVMNIPLEASLISGFYVILLVILIVYGLVGYGIEWIFNRRRIVADMRLQALESEAREALEEGTAEDTIPTEEDMTWPVDGHKMRTFEDLSRRLANILAVFAGAWALSYIWRIDIDMMGVPAAGRSYDVAFVLLVGYVIYHSVRIWMDQKIEEEGGNDLEVAPGDEGGAGGASRLATLLPLFRNFILAVIFVTVALIVLNDLGINVAPLFAGAGVVGLAIGFGAQTLVRDILSGAFYLFDDAFRKGEYIDIGTVKGTVERVSARSFQLRHHLGPLHTVPFGEIQFLTNFSRDWVMMKLPLRVTYDTDVEKVRKLVKKLGQELLNDDVVGQMFLQPLKSQGVIEMQDSAMIIRIKFMARPGDQWVLRKRVYQEIRDLFAREGIKFAHKEVTVRLAEGDSTNLTEQQKQTIAGAALAAQDEELGGEGNGGDDR
jgi:small-conductance mechanosensitive channel